MEIRNTEYRWGAVQQTLHWAVVLVVLGQLAVGFIFASLPSDSPLRAQLVPVHTTLGVSILALMLVRLLWRLANPVPTLPDTLRPWQKRLAHTNHWLLYIVLIAMPIAGYLLVNAHGQGVPFFGIELPRVIGESRGLQKPLMGVHVTGAFFLIALMVLHIAGALRHGLLLRDGVLRRMTPFRAR